MPDAAPSPLPSSTTARGAGVVVAPDRSLLMPENSNGDVYKATCTRP